MSHQSNIHIQVFWAKTHDQRMWSWSSRACLHITHILSNDDANILLARKTLEGKITCSTSHKNVCILGGTLRPQIIDHAPWTPILLELSRFLSNSFPSFALYDLPVVRHINWSLRVSNTNSSINLLRLGASSNSHARRVLCQSPDEVVSGWFQASQKVFIDTNFSFDRPYNLGQAIDNLPLLLHLSSQKSAELPSSIF